MAGKQSLKRSVKELKTGLKRVARAAAQEAQSGRGAKVNVAHRTNVIVAGNVGEPGSVQAASARQSGAIVQTPDGEPSDAEP